MRDENIHVLVQNGKQNVKQNQTSRDSEFNSSPSTKKKNHLPGRT
jgi:hypothetical protein